MRVRYMTSAFFAQNPTKAKENADEGPVIITDHGEPAYVVMRYAEFQATWKDRLSLYETLRDRNATAEGDFDPDRFSLKDRDVPL